MASIFGGGSNKVAVDPDKERLPPPQPTFVYFPQNDVTVQATDKWLEHTPHLDVHYAQIVKPSDIRLSHVAALNITLHNDEPLETFVPGGNLPPPAWIATALSPVRKPSISPEIGFDKSARLSNGHKVPDPETFVKYARELICNTDDAIRVANGQKVKSGRPAPHVKVFNEFWQHLSKMAQYWDTSLDHYYDLDSANATPASASKHTKRGSIFSLATKHLTPQPEPPKKDTGKRYKGRRISNGVRMPDEIRGDLVRSFCRVVVNVFECQFAFCRTTPLLEIGKLLIPVSQSGMAWRLPNSSEQSGRMGVVEGPILGVQCRNETNFLRDPQAGVVDLAREAAGLLLQAQQRARESKERRVPGRGQWYTSRPRWGGGPGGPFGEYEFKTPVEKAARRHPIAGQTLSPMKTEEEIWKELRPNDSQWAPRTSYLAIGKDRGHAEDVVFMVSALFHHIAFVKLRVHPAYVDWSLSGKKPPDSHPDENWYKPQMYRTRWFDLLDSTDRGEALRALWGIMAYQMRADRHDRPGVPRQNSEIGHRLHLGRKKPPSDEAAGLSTMRSHSVA